MVAGTGTDTIIDSELMQFAPLIILLPMLAFPVILFLGRVFNRNPFWKDTMKEGGIIALVVMASSLIISLLLIKDHLGGFASARAIAPLEALGLTRGGALAVALVQRHETLQEDGAAADEGGEVRR